MSPTFSAAKLKGVNLSFSNDLSLLISLSLQMYGLMNEVSEMYNQRLQDYADRQEMFNIKE